VRGVCSRCSTNDVLAPTTAARSAHEIVSDGCACGRTSTSEVAVSESCRCGSSTSNDDTRVPQ
jgi:hypothetical protein